MILQLCIVSLLLPMVSSGMTPHEFVEKVNEKRKELAEKIQLGNMRELIWDKELAVAVIDSWSNGTLRNTENVDLVNIDTFEEVLSSLNDSVGKDRQNLIEYSTTYFAPFLAPLHDRIGCSEVPEENAKHQYCYFTPIAPVKEMFDNFGRPGTRCSDGYVNVNGLCRVVTTTTSTSTTKKVTVKTSNSTGNGTMVDDVESSAVSSSVLNTIMFFMFSYFILFS
ncbi:unnamed protein product [Caenorhabditis brenneri]